jgi:hypothetical protein
MFSRKKAQENAKNQDGEIGVRNGSAHESILFLRHFLRLFAANSSSAA